MTDQLKNNFLKEAIRIGDDILAKAKEDKNGIYWETLTSYEENGEYKTKWYVADSIYSGSAGIILFLMELYKKTNDKKYYKVIKKAADWLVQYDKENKSDYFAFFTGRMGVAYTVIKCAGFFNDESYQEKGLNIAGDCDKFLKSERHVDDLINGYAGTLLGLLQIHAITKEEWLLDKIKAFANILIERANHGVKGLYWDRSHQQVRGLCGFSHGAAGIGAVFLELGRYFNNEAFYIVAEQAFLYETQYYDAKQGNWPDFRKGFYSRKDYTDAEEAYRKNDIEHFTTASDMNAWCHGAAGIGLSRLRAYDILKNELYKSQAEQAVVKTVITDVNIDYPARTFTVCHGGGGNADLFIEAYLQFNENKYMDYAVKVGKKVLADVAKGLKYRAGLAHATEEDLSLFMGNAGIGYFLLRLTDPENIPSIEYPRLTTQCAGNKKMREEFSSFVINKKLLEKIFNRTILFARVVAKKELDDFLLQIKGPDKRAFPDFIRRICKGLDKNKAEKLLEALVLEETKMLIEDEAISSALLYTKQFVLAKEIEELLKKDRETLLKMKFFLDKDIKTVNNKYNWLSVKDDVDSADMVAEDESMVLLLPTYNGVAEWRVSPLIEGILNVVKNETALEQVIDEVTTMFDAPANDKEAAMIRDSILNQCNELIKYGIIQPVKN